MIDLEKFATHNIVAVVARSLRHKITEVEFTAEFRNNKLTLCFGSSSTNALSFRAMMTQCLLNQAAKLTLGCAQNAFLFSCDETSLTLNHKKVAENFIEYIYSESKKGMPLPDKNEFLTLINEQYSRPPLLRNALFQKSEEVLTYDSRRCYQYPDGLANILNKRVKIKSLTGLDNAKFELVDLLFDAKTGLSYSYWQERVLELSTSSQRNNPSRDPRDCTLNLILTYCKNGYYRHAPFTPLYCPLSGHLLTDPVFADNGNTYDRTALELYLAEYNNFLPTLGKQNTKLITHNSIKEIVTSYQKQYPNCEEKIEPTHSDGNILRDYLDLNNAHQNYDEKYQQVRVCEKLLNEFLQQHSQLGTELALKLSGGNFVTLELANTPENESLARKIQIIVHSTEIAQFGEAYSKKVPPQLFTGKQLITLACQSRSTAIACITSLFALSSMNGKEFADIAQNDIDLAICGTELYFRGAFGGTCLESGLSCPDMLRPDSTSFRNLKDSFEAVFTPETDEKILPFKNYSY